MATQKDNKDKESFTVITPPGIACFVHVWEPFAFKGSKGEKAKDPQYRILLVFEKGTDLSELKKVAGKALLKKFGEDAKRMIKKGQLHTPFREGSEYEEYGAPFSNDGTIFISASSNGAPGVVDARAKPILKQQDFYAGCKARISVYAHAYDSMGNKGVTFLLNNVQKVGDGERISGRQNAEDEFDEVEDEGSGKGGDADDLF